MRTSQENSRAVSPEPGWRVAMAEFRSRAQRLFEAQRDRVACLEASIAEQLAAMDREDAGPTAASPDDPRDTRDASSAELERLQTQLTQSRKLLNARASELKQLRNLLAEQADGDDGVDVKVLLEELSEIRLERDELVERLADAQRQIEQLGDLDSEQLDSLQRRFEVAVQEIRELKEKNESLQRQVAQSSGGAAETLAVTTTGFDWEQQKLRLMQQLDEDFDNSNPSQRRTKLSMEHTIQITDQVVADKERQIAELKTQLEAHADRASDPAAAALLDNDEQIREERERLARLEEEWREKLRQAEIDISVERAKLARERSELEAKLRNLEPTGGEPAAGKPAAKQSGRWLSRLGLKDDDP